MVNHFCNNFWFDLPDLLGQFPALSLYGLYAFVKHSSNARKSHSTNYQA